MEHEYALLQGYNRASIGRWLQFVSASISAAIVFIVLSVVDVANKFGLDVNLPPTMLSLIGAGSVYIALYWLFSKYVWKITAVRRLLKVPNLAGTWHCAGLTQESQPNIVWTGRMKISQSWDKLRIRLDTEQSASDSVAAALLFDELLGYRLMYHYRNTPRIGEIGLSAHHGFAELLFSEDGLSAAGEYFNGRGRSTWGTLLLTKEPS